MLSSIVDYFVHIAGYVCIAIGHFVIIVHFIHADLR